MIDIDILPLLTLLPTIGWEYNASMAEEGENVVGGGWVVNAMRI